MHFQHCFPESSECLIGKVLGGRGKTGMSAEVRNARGKETQMSNKRLLVVDDEQTTREMLHDYITDAGYEVVTAAGGEDALRKFEPEKFACIICDLFMPDKSGLEVLKTVRRQDSRVVFLMVTGYPSIDNAIQAMKEGASDYITKPFHMEDVLFKVERALNTKKMETSLKTVTGLFWGIIISIPIWLILGIILGIFWIK